MTCICSHFHTRPSIGPCKNFVMNLKWFERYRLEKHTHLYGHPQMDTVAAKVVLKELGARPRVTPKRTCDWLLTWLTDHCPTVV